MILKHVLPRILPNASIGVVVGAGIIVLIVSYFIFFNIGIAILSVKSDYAEYGLRRKMLSATVWLILGILLFVDLICVIVAKYEKNYFLAVFISLIIAFIMSLINISPVKKRYKKLIELKKNVSKVSVGG